MLAEHRAQRRLRDLRGRDHEVLDLDDRVLRLDDPEVGDRVHPHGDVVLRDHLLRGHVQGDRAQVDLHHPVDDRDQQEEARPLRLRQQAAEPEDDAALVLARDLHGGKEEQQQQEGDCGDGDQRDHGSHPFGSRWRSGRRLGQRGSYDELERLRVDVLDQHLPARLERRRRRRCERARARRRRRRGFRCGRLRARRRAGAIRPPPARGAPAPPSSARGRRAARACRRSRPRPASRPGRRRRPDRRASALRSRT